MGFLSGKKLRKVLSSVRQAEAKPYDGVKESKKALIAELQGSQPGEELPQRFELEASLPIKGSPRCSPSEESPAVEDARKRLIIGIDFGTTYSGVTYCFPDKRNAKPRAVVNWPGAAHGSAPKIPTLISYDKQDPGIFKWGALVDKKSDAIVGVKLLLDPSQKSPSYLPARNVKKDMKLLPKPPVDIAADFLRVLNAHAMSQIEQATPAGAMEGREKEYVLSVPAVWSDVAKDATPGSMSSILGPRPAFERAGREAYNFVQAAEKAGISPITLIKEPEAAALYALRDEDYAVEPKDCFVICDAGGGTVDLISYEVGSTKPTLEVHEVIPGTGATVGSLGLNKRFAEAVQSLFDEDDWPGVKRSEDFRHAERKFEDEVKKGFQGRPDEEYLIYFPRVGLADDPENGIVSNVWTMKIDDVRAIFEPVVTDILRLIKDQVQSVKLKRRNDKVAGIVLVGGFGSSQYLKHRVQTEHPHIHVFQPADAWAAIVKGAVLSKLPGEAIVSSTAAVRHYGIEVSSLYDEVRDAGRLRIKNDYDGSNRVKTMVWYINIGDNIRRDQTIQLPVYRCVPVDSDAKAFLFYSQLIEAEDEIAPLYRSEGQKIKVCCRLKSDLSGVPRSKFNKKIGEEGKQYWEVQYNLVIAFKSALMSFSLELDGETIGSVEAHFAH